jgi:hypothetical protein
MKRRVPANLSSAASQIAEALGPERMAEIVRRSPTLVYKWADPDLAYFPNLQQALELDAAFVSAGHGSPPFLTAYTTLLKQRTTVAQGVGDALSDAARIINVACDILAEISTEIESAQGKTGPRQTSRCNICENLRRLGELQASLSWNMEHNPNQVACPLRRVGADNVECSIGKAVE